MRSVPETWPLSEASSTAACSSSLAGLLRILQQHSACGGERDLAAAAIEERQPYQLFECLDLLRHRRLREVELLRCAPEAALLPRRRERR